MIWIALLLLLIPFGLVPFFGAPYVPSKSRTLIPFLKELKVKKGQTLLDIGSGDGTVLKHAAKELGLKTHGIELNPFLVTVTRLRLFSIRKQATVQFGDLWAADLPDVDVIYAFIMPKYMKRLEEKIQSSVTKKTLVVTYSFEFPGRKPFQEKDGFKAYHFAPLAKK